MRLNNYQQKAVDEFDHDLLLLAGAGTGKTRVLTEKYLRLIIDKGFEPKRIVAITFTQKAALEMRGRISEAMNQRYKEALNLSEKNFWERHLKSLEDAYIGTFHGLCGNILRENPNSTGFISGKRILSEGEERILISSAAENACTYASHHGSPEERELFLNAVIKFGLHFFLDQLRSCFSKIRESGLPVSEWVQCSDFAFPVSNQDLLKKLHEAIAELLNSDARKKATENSRRLLQELDENIDQLLPKTTDTFLECTSKLRRLKTYVPKTMGRDLRPYIDEVHDVMERFLSEKSHLEFQKWAECFSRYFQILTDTYNEEKRLQNALDFTDLQLNARDLLRDNPQLREEIQKRYDYFLVDEFQDTNLLQLEIIRLLVGNTHANGRLFVVGDAKQSIYRFRGAQVQVVKDLEDELMERNGQVLPLVENYRCHPAIIDLINHISGYTFQDDEIQYQELVASRSDDFSDVPRMRLLTGISSREEEAEKLADYIHYLVEEEQPPVNLGEGKNRKLCYGDIALLFRAMTHIETYTAAFEKRRIPFTLSSGSGYYGLQEVQDQLNLIRLVHNSRDGIALLAVLRSPYGGLSDADLFWLAQDQNDLVKTFYDQNKKPTQLSDTSWQRVLKLRQWIVEQQLNRSFLTVSEIIRQALNDLGYLHVLAAFPGAERSLANIDKLLHKADSFAEVNGRYGIGQFIDYVGNMVAFQEREGEANLESEGSNAVQLMTIHASKGLEFPLVVLTDLERKMIQPERSSIIYHPQIGLGFKVPDGSGYMYETPVRNRIKEMNQSEERSELRRLLYVALTRARDYLVLSGISEESSSEKEKSWGDWIRASFPADAWQHESFQLAGREVRIIKEIPIAVQTTAEQQDNWWELIHPYDEIAATVGKESLLAVQEIKPQNISVTSLLGFLECPRNYYLVYRMGLKSGMESENYEGEEGTAFGVLIGRIVHALCALNLREPTAIKQRIVRGLSGISNNEREVTENTIYKLFEAYRQSSYHDVSSKSYSEYPFTISIDSSHRIHGIIDRLVLMEDGIQLVDFKTNRIYNAEQLKKLVDHYKPQILTYAYAVRKIFKIIPKSDLFFLDNGSHHYFCFTEEELDDWGRVLNEAMIKIGQGSNIEDFPVTANCSECSRRPWCPI